MRMYLMSVETAANVYEAFIMAEALKEDERLQILARFVLEGKVQSMEVNATKAEVVQELERMFTVWKNGKRT